MPHPNVTAIFPSFEDPDHFESTVTGRYVCKLCSASNRSPRIFKTEKSALAHERSADHVFFAGLEKNSPWDGPAADSAGWVSDAAHEHHLTLEQAKDQEYRQRVSELPAKVMEWQTRLLACTRDGEMLPADAPPPPSRRKLRRIKAAKMADTSSEIETKMTQTSETASERESAPVQIRPAHVKKVSTSPPIELTPELHQWMAMMVIEMRFSPTRARQMREFIQLPTDTKVDMIVHSTWDLREMLFA